MRPLEEVLPLLQTSKRIFITTHHKPDGDAVGSIMALYHYLTKKGHKATPVVTSELPDFLEWVPGVERIINYESEPAKADAALKNAELIFCLDFNDYSRTKHLEQQLADAVAPKVLIDHHLFPKPVWDYGISLPHKSSTCEMVYDFINLAGGNEQIDVPIAECIYLGVMTDTGSFRFPVTSASVHLMIADLMNKGLEHSRIHDLVYDSWSTKRMQFLGYVLLERMEIFPKQRSGLICLSRKDMKLFEVTTGDTEGLVNYPLSIKFVRFATLITERSDEVKLSFRSKGDFDVSDFARKHFSGGGHFNASGGRSSSSFVDTVAYFKQILSDIHPR